MEWRLTNETELDEVATAVLAELKKRQNGAAVLALSGDLGAGKTTFIQHLAKALGVTESVTSPTFVIMKSYDLEGQGWEELIHIDAYRIEDIDEMRPLGFAALLEKKEAIVCIEWAEKITALLPPETLHLDITSEGKERTFTLHAKEK